MDPNAPNYDRPPRRDRIRKRLLGHTNQRKLGANQQELLRQLVLRRERPEANPIPIGQALEQMSKSPQIDPRWFTQPGHGQRVPGPMGQPFGGPEGGRPVGPGATRQQKPDLAYSPAPDTRANTGPRGTPMGHQREPAMPFRRRRPSRRIFF